MIRGICLAPLRCCCGMLDWCRKSAPTDQGPIFASPKNTYDQQDPAGRRQDAVSDSGSSSRIQPTINRSPDAAKSAPDINGAAPTLQERLFNAQIEQKPGSLVFYIPQDKKSEIITFDIFKDHAQLSTLPAQAKTAQEAFDGALDLFTILASVKREYDICQFMEEGISDADLPFQYQVDHRILKRRNGDEILCARKWSPMERVEFATKQWTILVPVFDSQRHRKLADNTILPFRDESMVSEGAYSEVWQAKIHHAHHHWHQPSSPRTEPLSVAIKKLHFHDKDDFDKEREILVTLEQRRHAHLVKLLFSYEYKGSYHLVFLCACGNLRNYWEQHPDPAPASRELVLWSLEQMLGIANGLNIIHNFHPTKPLIAPEDHKRTGTETQTPQGRAVMRVSRAEERFGRHGDLKPENILWFPANAATTADTSSPTATAPNAASAANAAPIDAVCQITDFGLGRFHGRDTRTKAAPYTIFSSPTYEPPECHVFMAVSRAYDLWSLGCLFLEWVSWLLKGWDAIDAFARCRVEESLILNGDGKISDDYFWTLVVDGTVRDAVIRGGVTRWVGELRGMEGCSPLLCDLLDLIMSDLLCIKPSQRAQAKHLNLRLKELLERAKEKSEYVIPAPRSDLANGTVQPLSQVQLS